MLDPALDEGLAKSVREAGQSETVARRLAAWLHQMSGGVLSKEDEARFLLAVCGELDLGPDNAD